MTSDAQIISRDMAVIGQGVAGADVTHIIFILDRSGSMQGKEADVIGGFNAYVERVRQSGGGLVGISYVRFDNAIELVWNDLPIGAVEEMTAEHYQPRGSTALLDAVGMTVSAVQPVREHSYTVIIHTDGMENASREWTNSRVKALIEARDAAGNWTFSFFGCAIDTWAQAGAWGMDAGSHTRMDSRTVRETYEAKARVTNMLRNRGIKSSRDYAAAAAAASAGADDDEIERIARGEGKAPDAARSS